MTTYYCWPQGQRAAAEPVDAESYEDAAALFCRDWPSVTRVCVWTVGDDDDPTPYVAGRDFEVLA